MGKRIEEQINEIVDIYTKFYTLSEQIDQQVFDEHDRSSWGYYFRSRHVSAQKRIEAQSIVINIQKERKLEHERLSKLYQHSVDIAHHEIDLLVNKHIVTKLLEFVEHGKRRDSEINFSSWWPWDWRLPGKFKAACIRAEERLNIIRREIDSELVAIHGYEAPPAAVENEKLAQPASPALKPM